MSAVAGTDGAGFPTTQSTPSSTLAARELAQLVLGLMGVAGETGRPGDGRPMGALELAQADFEFASEFADSLNVGRASGVTFSGFVGVLRDEPALFECFAVALRLPVDGLVPLQAAALAVESTAGRVGEAVEAVPPAAATASAASAGATFDFGLLRTIRDRYSIDVTKGRGSSEDAIAAATAAAAAAGSRGARTGKGADIPSISSTYGTSGGGSGADLGRGGDSGDDIISVEGGGGGGGGGGYTILGRAVDRANFRKVLRDLWRCPANALFLADRLFDTMDADGSGSIDVRELYNGIAAALRGSVAARAAFFFSLFGAEGEGHMQSNEGERGVLRW